MAYPSDLLYVLLYARGKSMRYNENIPSKTHLQKEMFLLQRRCPFTELNNPYEFSNLYYNVFSKEIVEDLNAGIELGFIPYDNGISLTPQGFKHASTIWASLADNYRKTVIQIKEEYNRMTGEQLLSYVYDHYSKFTTKSALMKGPVDDYFDKFWKENQLTDSYFAEIVRKSREDSA